MVWKATDPQGHESAKVAWDLVPYTNGRGLDVGCGPAKAFQHFIGVDNMNHAISFGWKYRPDVHAEATDLSVFGTDSMDFVFSSHTLEHVEDYRAALKEWWRVIKKNGYLCLYLPHKDFYPNIGEEGANPDHKHDFLPSDIIDAMKELSGWDLVVNEERNGGREYSFFQVYKKKSSEGSAVGELAEHLESWKDPKPEKTCAVVRYGAFGDCIQASSIFPWLKEQGYHITFYTVARGYDVVKHDPHIDRFIVQGTDQVPNAALGDFWDHEREKYDRFINLSESVERTLLTVDSSQIHFWPTKARHALLNKNYMEMVHQIAEVPMPSRQWFYPNDQELQWVSQQKEAAGKCILWCLTGSSIHKIWPNMDAVVARIMTDTDYKIVFVGDAASKMIEEPWVNEPRIYCRSGEWEIRQSMAFAQVADMIIGPETGILNSVARTDQPKIVFLSHSSPENLTKFWKNAWACVPHDTPCWPCHQMHYNFDYCNRAVKPGEPGDGAALCQANISADQVWEAFKYFERK